MDIYIYEWGVGFLFLCSPLYAKERTIASTDIQVLSAH